MEFQQPGGGSKIGDLTDDGGVTSSEADTSSFSSSAHGTEESNILGLENVLDWRKLWINEDVLRLTSEGGVVDFHLVGLEHADITWDVLTSLDLDDISWHNVLGIDLGISALSDDVSNRWDEVLELSHHLGRFGSLHVRENTGGERDSSQHDTKVKVRLVETAVLLNTITNETEERTEPK